MKKIFAIIVLGGISFGAQAQAAEEAATRASNEDKKTELAAPAPEADMSEAEVKEKRQQNAEYESKKSSILNSSLTPAEKEKALAELEADMKITPVKKTKPKTTKVGGLE